MGSTGSGTDGVQVFRNTGRVGGARRKAGTLVGSPRANRKWAESHTIESGVV